MGHRHGRHRRYRRRRSYQGGGCLVLLLLIGVGVSCDSLGITYGVGVGYPMGPSTVERDPFSSAGVEVQNAPMLFASIDFSPYQAKHYSRMERFAEIGLRANPTVSLMDREWLAHIQDDGDDAPEADLVDYVPPIAETTEEAWPFLIWAGAVAILAAAVGGLWWIGFPLPLVKPRKRPENCDESAE